MRELMRELMRKQKHGLSGFTAIELMITLGVSAIIMVGVSTMMFSNISSLTKSQNYTDQLQLSAALMRALTGKNPAGAAINANMNARQVNAKVPLGLSAGNNALTVCENTGSTCRTVNRMPLYVFALNAKTFTAPTATDPGTALAGPATGPARVRFTEAGRPCNRTEAMNAKLCPIEAHAFVTITCANGKDTCPAPAREVLFQFELVPSIPSDPDIAKKVRAVRNFNPTTLEGGTSIQSSINFLPQVCPSGKILSAIDLSSGPTCLDPLNSPKGPNCAGLTGIDRLQKQGTWSCSHDLVKADQKCAGGYIKGVDQGGHVICETVPTTP